MPSAASRLPFARAILGAALLASLVAPTASTAQVGPSDGDEGLYTNGRQLDPAGRQTRLGNFPNGGALTPDGRHYWAVDAGHGVNDVKVMRVSDGEVIQTLPLPGGFVGVAFAPDGKRAYVSGQKRGCCGPQGETKGNEGDVIHVFDVDPKSGRASELDPISIPATSGGSYRENTLPPEPDAKNWPVELAVTPDGRTLVVALNHADRAAIIDLASKSVSFVEVGAYPYGVAIDPTRPRAYVSNEYSGTVSVIDLNNRSVIKEIGVGGPAGDQNAHPEALLADPKRDRLYAAVASRDLIAVIDTASLEVIHHIDVGREEAVGTSPVALAISPDGKTLYSADAGEDAVAAIALTDRPQPKRPSGSPPARAFDLIGRIPTAAYTTDVEVTRDGKRLIWVAAKGLGAGPNPDYEFEGPSPYGQYIPQMLIGRAGVLSRPSDSELAPLTARVDRQVVPTNHSMPPPGTPIMGQSGGPSDQIKYVFYVIRENRTYDQVFGSEPRGDGEPSLELLGDNGKQGPTGGITPNAHALARTFPLLDHVYANSEVSIDGHLIATGGYAIDYAQKHLHPGYSGRGTGSDVSIFPVSFPPNHFVLDQAARENVSFRAWGELGAGNQPFGNDGRPTFPTVMANTDFAYPSNLFLGCQSSLPGPNVTRCTQDSGIVNGQGQTIGFQSRINAFQAQFQAMVQGGTVPRFNLMLFGNDHTNGTTPGVYSPQAQIADNDLALGQLVELVSNSPIWKESAIFVVEDDSQDGADHVDAHRMPAFVISPWAKEGAVVSTRYDHYSFLRTAMLIAGLDPLSLNDALATPMYDAFISGAEQPDVEGTRYRAIMPEQPLDEVNPANAPNAALSAAMPWEQTDYVPQAISDRILWQSTYGLDSTAPPPGPNASPTEHLRAIEALSAWRRGEDPSKLLLAQGGGEEGEEELSELLRALAVSHQYGLSMEEAEELVEGAEGGPAAGAELAEAEEAEDADNE